MNLPEIDQRFVNCFDLKQKQLEETIRSERKLQSSEEDQFEGGAPVLCSVGTQTDDIPGFPKRKFVFVPSDKYVLDATRKATLAVEAKIKLILEDTVHINPRFKTIFSGLKKNHAHNVALVHPMSFLIRRVVYAALVIFMFDMPLFVALILLLASHCFLAFVIVEKLWEDSIINQQHLVNEVALYVCLVLVFLLSGSIVPLKAHKALGWTIIGIVLALCLYNSVVIAFLALNFFKKFLRSVYNRAELKNSLKTARNSPVIPKLPLQEKNLA